MRPPVPVGLRIGDRSVDVAVPPTLALHDVLRSAGVPLDVPALTVVDSTGAVVDLYRTTGEALVPGSVLHVLVPSAVPPEGPRAEEDPLVMRPPVAWLGLAGALTAAVVGATVLALGTDGPGGARWAVAAAVLLAASVSATGARTGRWGGALSAVVPLAGAAAGALTVPPMGAATALLVVAALVGATVVAGARWALTRGAGASADIAAVVLATTASSAAVCAAVLLLGLPPVLAAGALLGAVPLGMRALPALAVDVPDTQLVDVDLVARTVPSVRARPQRSEPVEAGDVTRMVRSAERRRDAGAVLLAALAAAAAPVLLAYADDTVTRVGSLVAAGLVVTALALQPRTTRGGLARWAPRLAAGAVLVEAVVAVEGPVLPVAGALVALGLLVALLALPVLRGWRSVGLSRLADGIEGLATALALPSALTGAGAVEALRLVTS